MSPVWDRCGPDAGTERGTARERTRERALTAFAPERATALLDLWVASWAATFPQIDFEARRSWFVERLAALHSSGSITTCAVASGDGALLGFVTIDPVSGELDQLCVAPSAQGRGVAQALLAHAQAQAPGRVRLTVNADNHRAIRFYERAGFRAVGEGVNALSGLRTIGMVWTAIPPP